MYLTKGSYVLNAIAWIIYVLNIIASIKLQYVTILIV